MKNEDYLMTTIEAAEFLGFSKNTLIFWRSKNTTIKNTPPYLKIGGHVRYSMKDLKKFIEKSKII